MADLQMSFFGFGKSAEVSIVLKDIDNRKRISHRISDRSKFYNTSRDPNPNPINRFLISLLEREDLLLYYDGETIAGHVQVDLKGAKFEHKVRKQIYKDVKIIKYFRESVLK